MHMKVYLHGSLTFEYNAPFIPARRYKSLTYENTSTTGQQAIRLLARKEKRECQKHAASSAIPSKATDFRALWRTWGRKKTQNSMRKLHTRSKFP